MPVTKRLRFEILRRDNHACRYCGRMAPDVKLTIDHVIPTSLGGTDDPENLVSACSDCNSGKTSSSPDAPIVADVAQDALRWRKAMEVAAEMAQRDREAQRAYTDEFRNHWDGFTYTSSGEHIPLPSDWRIKVGELMSTGLLVADLHEAIDITMAAKGIDNEFYYFIGVCRNRLSQRQSIAQELIRRGLA